MKDQITDIAKDWITLGLAGLGITFSAHAYFGGLLLGLASASLAWQLSAQKDHRRFWLVMLTAFIVTHVAALLAEHWLPNFSMQLVMMAAGFISRWAVQFAINLVERASSRGDELADRVIDRVLPEKGDKK